MKALIILNRQPYDGTDAAWNGLRLVDELAQSGNDVRVFRMNEPVELACDVWRLERGEARKNGIPGFAV